MILNYGKCEGHGCNAHDRLFIFIDDLGLKARLCINCFEKYSRYLMERQSE